MPTAPATRWRRSGLPAYVPALLLLAEIALLKLGFKTDVLEGSPLWWAAPLRALRFNTPLGLCALAGVLLIGRRRILEAFRSESLELERAESLEPEPPRSLILPALLHAAGATLFTAATAVMLRPGVGDQAYAPFLPLPWLAGGLAAVLGAAGLSIPFPALRRLARRLAWVLVLGIGLGLAAFAVGNSLSGAWPLADPLTGATLWMSDRLLGLVLEERIYEPENMVLGTEAFPVHVTKFCSGYEGISLFLVFFCLFLVLWRERLRFPRALLLIPIGMLAAWLLNAGRIAALVLVGTYVSPEVAVEGFHVYAGWPLLCAVALGCVALGTRLSLFSADPPAERGGVNPTAVYLGPLLVFTACGLVAGAITRHPEHLYAARMIPVVLVLWLRRREIRDVVPPLAGGRGGVAAPLLFGFAGFVVWTALVLAVGRGVPAGDSRHVLPGSTVADFLSWTGISWGVRALGMCTVTPVFEELAFRGFLARRVVAADFERVDPRTLGVWPFLVSTVAFGLLHPNVLAASGAGAVFFLAYRRSGRLRDAIVAHAATNILVIFATVVTRDVRIWG